MKYFSCNVAFNEKYFLVFFQFSRCDEFYVLCSMFYVSWFLRDDYLGSWF